MCWGKKKTPHRAGLVVNVASMSDFDHKHEEMIVFDAR